MKDIASVRLVHGSIINRMTKEEVTPNVSCLSFSPYSSNLFCVTGLATFKIFLIEQNIARQQLVHFRSEFYHFTCHCWLENNSILVIKAKQFLSRKSDRLATKRHGINERRKLG